MDNRDAGESDPESEPYTMADFGDDAAALLEVLGIPRAHVLGASMGGWIAVHLALNHPTNVDHLVLSSTGNIRGLTDPTQVPVPDRATWIVDPVERMLRGPGAAAPGYFTAHPEQRERFAQRYRGNRTTYDGMVRHLIANATHDVSDRLHEITAPTLVIHGELDPLAPLARGMALAEAIPGARFVMFQGVGHIPQIECADAFNHTVLDFLHAKGREPINPQVCLSQRGTFRDARRRVERTRWGWDHPTFSHRSVPTMHPAS